MDDVNLDIARPQPAREPEPVAASLKGEMIRLMLRPVGPASWRQRCKSFSSVSSWASNFLRGWRSTPCNQRRNQPLRLAHRDHSDDCAILLESGEGPARIKTKMLRHGGAPLVAVEQRLWCHVLADAVRATSRLIETAGKLVR
jgi:hypothetical protein